MFRKLLALLGVGLVLLAGPPALAVPAGVAPAPSLTSIASLGYALRLQGWSPIGSFSHNLSASAGRAPGTAFTGALNGVSWRFQQVSPVSVPAIRLVYSNYFANATPAGELPALNDIYVRARPWYHATSKRGPEVFFGGESLVRIPSQRVVVSDPVAFAVTAVIPFDTITYAGVTGTTNVIPTSSGPLQTGINPSSQEGTAAEDVTQSLFAATNPGSSSFLGYGEAVVLGYTGTSPIKSINCTGDSIPTGSGDAGGQRNGVAGWCVRAANNSNTPASVYPPTAPRFGLIVTAVAGETMSNFLNTDQNRTRVALGSLASTTISDLGVNDLADSLVTLKANKLLEAALWASQGQKFVTTTITPRTTSTDAWTTVANQTVISAESRRTGFNDWLLDTSASGFVAQAAAATGLPRSQFGVFDAAGAVEVNSANVLTRNGGFWKAPTVAAEYSGTVTGSANTQSFVDSALTPSTVNAWRGCAIRFTTGALTGTNLTIQLSTTGKLLQTQGLGGTPSVGNAYSIYCTTTTQDGTHPTSYGHSLISTAFGAAYLANPSLVASAANDNHRSLWSVAA